MISIFGLVFVCLSALNKQKNARYQKEFNQILLPNPNSGKQKKCLLQINTLRYTITVVSICKITILVTSLLFHHHLIF